jgi:methionine-rich copper-binding protein CopC
MIKALLTTLVALAVTALMAPPGSAHTAMLRASPGRDATAGGTIGFIDLEFLDPVTNAAVTVTYNGAPVAGGIAEPDGEVITFTLDQPLSQPGRYQVNYEMTSSDGDFTTGGYFFTFDPAADQVARIDPTGSGDFSSTTLALSGAGLAVVVALIALFVWQIENRRRQLILEATEDVSLGARHNSPGARHDPGW